MATIHTCMHCITNYFKPSTNLKCKCDYFKEIVKSVRAFALGYSYVYFQLNTTGFELVLVLISLALPAGVLVIFKRFSSNFLRNESYFMKRV